MENMDKLLTVPKWALISRKCPKIYLSDLSGDCMIARFNEKFLAPKKSCQISMHQKNFILNYDKQSEAQLI